MSGIKDLIKQHLNTKLYFTIISQECSGSICLKFNLEECYCDPPAKEGDSDYSCHLCCLEIPSKNTSTSIKVINKVAYLPHL